MPNLNLQLVLYSKPGCHLCEGLQEKLEQVRSPSLTLEVRDITSRDDWFQAYQYEIPVLFLQDANSKLKTQNLKLIPRPSPRSTVAQLEQMLQNYATDDRTE